MNHFKAYEVLDILATLSLCSFAFKGATDKNGASLPIPHGPEVDSVCADIEKARDLCAEAGFSEAAESANVALSLLRMHDPLDSTRLDAELSHVAVAILRDAKKRSFLFIQADRVDYLDHEALFGLEVFNAFPSARPDIREAGNCLAVECPTAAVFHSMRAVEWGLRAFCAHLGFRRLTRRNRRTGETTHVPATHLDWETMLNQAQSRAEKKFKHVKRGKNRDAYQLFYYPALEEIRAIREVWRNHIMHTRDEYSRKDADAILDHVRRLLTKLAERVSES